MKFQVWMEGFSVTGQDGTATFYGEAEAETFEEAVRIATVHLDQDPKWWGTYEGVISFWGCRFFDNEQDAREVYG